ncbi:MAG: hypothetical protein C0603_02470 [Denitrovibrio sp.]|nr:MAG: hypothetical protein C0603_02470 [Denitrovibrio sp.]
MSKINFLQIYNNALKKADEFLNSEMDENFLKRYEAYSTSLEQLTQILKEIENKDEVKSETEKILEVHKKVEDRLISEKDGLFKNIRTLICREHIQHKYYSKSIKSTLVDRKS